jgi:hypothetical protein
MIVSHHSAGAQAFQSQSLVTFVYFASYTCNYSIYQPTLSANICLLIIKTPCCPRRSLPSKRISKPLSISLSLFPFNLRILR